MNNKIALITDQHFQARKTSKQFHDYFLRFYDEIFFPYLEKNEIKTVIDLGDTFDNRNYIDPAALEWAKTNYYDRLKKLNINHHIIVGNHTAKHKNTNKINSVDLILREYDNIKVYADPTEVCINGLNIIFVPWINKENEAETNFKLQNTKATVVMGHLELNGFKPYVGHVMEDGMDPNVFMRFKKVFSGHYHTRSDNGTIFYIGNPYELYFNDIDDTRGFVVFDPENLDHDYINNPFKMHYHIQYDSEKVFTSFDEYKDKIVKVIVKERNNIKRFENFVSILNKSNPMDLKIIDSVSLPELNAFESLETEDTLTILTRYIDEMDIEVDKSKIKGVITATYKEALQLA